jgi:hypothetical protein
METYWRVDVYLHIYLIYHYTQHGLHLNSKGKECMASKIAKKIVEVLIVNKSKPIQKSHLKW